VEQPKPRNSNRKVTRRQGPIAAARAPKVVSELLTLREACARDERLYPQLIWMWASEGLLHPVRPHGRVLYPEWELSELVKRLYRAGSEYATRAA